MDATASTLGEFRWNVTTDQWAWPREMFRMHGYEPGRVRPTTALVLEHKTADAAPGAARLLALSQHGDQAFDNYHRIIDSAGREKVVLSVGRSRLIQSLGLTGPVRTAVGFMADVTEPHQAARSEAVVAARRSQATIQQTLGALVVMGGVTADEALMVIKTRCEPRNVSFSSLAERFVALAGEGVLTDQNAVTTLERLSDETDPSDSVMCVLIEVLRQVRGELAS